MGACEPKEGLILGPVEFFRMLPFYLSSLGVEMGERGKTASLIFNKTLSLNHLPSFD